MASFEQLRPVLEECGQLHLLEGAEQLPAEQQAQFLEQLQVRRPAPAPALLAAQRAH